MKNQIYSADYFIEKLALEPHIEGGYYKEIYRNSTMISDDQYLHKFEGERALSTTIYFLLKSGQVSKFHKLKFDEIWFYHYGCGMDIHIIDENGKLKTEKLGLNIENGESPQILVPANHIFGAEPNQNDSFSLVSCLVSPGFDFRDFVLYNENELRTMFPQNATLISKFY
jgi:hypothetical protein